VLAGSRPPSRSNEPALATAPFGTAEMSLRASPGRPGTNELRFQLSGPGSRPGPARITVGARQRRLGLGPFALVARRTGEGRFVVARAPLDAPGTWELTVAGGREQATLHLRLR
jgi:hypothetical protein